MENECCVPFFREKKSIIIDAEDYKKWKYGQQGRQCVDFGKETWAPVHSVELSLWWIKQIDGLHCHSYRFLSMLLSFERKLKNVLNSRLWSQFAPLAQQFSFSKHVEPEKNSLGSCMPAGCLLTFVHVVFNGIWVKFAKIIHIYWSTFSKNFWIKVLQQKKKKQEVQTHTDIHSLNSLAYDKAVLDIKTHFYSFDPKVKGHGFQNKQMETTKNGLRRCMDFDLDSCSGSMYAFVLQRHFWFWAFIDSWKFFLAFILQAK